uniref:Uncharacterized protein n=1 Tax=Oryza meridionalis TaxID=40149 RepID=A0A0E0EWA7_9ORYZ
MVPTSIFGQSCILHKANPSLNYTSVKSDIHLEESSVLLVLNLKCPDLPVDLQATVCPQFSSAGPSISRVCTQTIGDATAGAAAARRRFSFASQKSIRDSAALAAPRHCHVPTTGAACWHHRPAAADLMEDNINTDNMADSSHVPVPPPN